MKPGMTMPNTASPAGAMDPNMSSMGHRGYDAMTGALGRYPMEREASGTGAASRVSPWQPKEKPVGLTAIALNAVHLARALAAANYSGQPN